MPRTLLFDVNETMLDLSALDAPFAEHFGDASVKAQWFAQVLRTGMTATMIGDYRDFGEVGAAALDVVARIHDVALDDEARRRILGTMRELPAHDDVPPALDRLARQGHRLAALTNSTLEAAKEQLGYAGIADRFVSIMSADSTGSLKPAKAVYRHGADVLGVDTASMWMVAAHDWDIAGAMAAGCRGIFVARPGMVTNPLYPEPDLVVADFTELAEQLEE